MDGQLAELLTNYGEIGGIWFDGWWDRKDQDWRLDQTYKLIHDLQPQCLVGNNHHRAPKPGEDFQMFEKDLPGHNTAGFNKDSRVGDLPLETCETMNNSWGFNLRDKSYKSSADLIRYLVRSAGYDANFLLNVGPMPNGEIQQEFIDTLKVVGKWMEKYGETIYGTRGGPVPPHDWGVTTYKDNVVYIHILDWQDDAILIPDVGFKIDEVVLFESKKKLEFDQGEFGTVISLPEEREGVPDLVVEVRVK